MVHTVKGPYEAFIKRLLDIFISLIVILLFWWLYIILAVLVGIKLGRPVLFSQARPGRKDKHTGEERIFRLYKFRSMTNATDSSGNLLPDTERLTKFGRLLRSSSLDELPEIWNILIGDMSLIGPRPLAASYLPYYTEEERMRHCVRPGLTGLAQVNGRNSISWEEKFAFDIEYANNITFLNDCKILLQTVKAVICREGIGQAEEAPVSFNILRQQQWDAKHAETETKHS